LFSNGQRLGLGPRERSESRGQHDGRTRGDHRDHCHPCQSRTHQPSVRLHRCLRTPPARILRLAETGGEQGFARFVARRSFRGCHAAAAGQVNYGESHLGLRWKRAPHARRRLMRNSRYALILLIALLVLSSGVVARPQAPSRPARPAAVSRTPPRAVTAPTTNDPFIGVWKLNPRTSKYESGGAPTSFTRTYEDRGGGTIFMTTDVTIPQGSTRAYLVYRRDGRPYPEAAAGVQAIRMVSIKATDPHRGRLLGRRRQAVGHAEHDHSLGRRQDDDAGGDWPGCEGKSVHQYDCLRQTAVSGAAPG